MRDTQYEFISTQPEEIIARLTRKYEEITGVTVEPASLEALFIRWVADVIVQERALMNHIGRQNVPSRAEGESLDALAELFFARERAEARSAVCTVRFYISEAQEGAVIVPAGTRVADESRTLYWATEADAYIPIGDTHIDLQVRCQTAGTVGNGWTPGQINTLVDVFDYYSRCENTTRSDGGADRMTDDELYESMRLSMDALSTAGARGSYIYHAKAVSTQIADVAAVSPTPGVVKLYVLMDDGTPAGEEMKQAVLAACSAEDVRPLTDKVSVEDAETAEYDVDITYYLQNGISRSAAEIGELVRAAVDEYAAWQAGKLGRDINPSKLYQLLMGTGVKRVELRSPVFRALRCGDDESVPELAKLKSKNIVNGGYEDE